MAKAKTVKAKAKAVATPKAPKAAPAKTNPKPDTVADFHAKKVGEAIVQFLNLPAAQPIDVDLSALIFDRKLQHRAELTNEPTVKAYRESLQSGEKFPRLKVIREKQKDGDPKFWVYDGFQRGKAYELEGVESVPCDVIDGTFGDAFFLSLKSNSDNSLLPRTPDDKKRSILALIENPEAFKIVQEKVRVKGSGGMQRVLGKAVGASGGYVDEVLEGIGKSVKGDKLVARREKRTTPTQPANPPANPSQSTLDAGNVSQVVVNPDPGFQPPAPANEPPTPEQQRAATQAAYASFTQEPIANRIQDAYKAVKRLGLLVSSLIQDQEHGAEFRDLLGRYGIPIAEEFDVKAREEGNAFQPYYEILEHWEPAQKIGAVLNLFKRRVNEANEQPAEQPTEPTA